ncbi:OsmC family protein [uncultured Proteiniphilum sp.]|mgnify:CR=1 FL=1|uniref:OsmC family protein n=1 Tax=uncultured Proteiniphilum sp. TaxID=497637 RepID=UPI00260296E9|nr:OsmC family protein [uncultured Proteiniphilum sp.]
MAIHSIKTVWRENNIFDTDIDGHTITLDMPGETGNDTAGPGPKKLQLVAAATCSGLDIVAMARKMRIDLKNFDIRIDAEVAEEHPKQYTSMKVIYEFEGDGLPENKLERACELSFDKYCGVLAMYKKAVPVTYEVAIKNG